MQPEVITPDVLTLARLETRWHAPWIVAGLSHWGQHHAEVGLPNQDAYVIGRKDRTTWLVLADGVSSAPCAGEGAELATRFVSERIADLLCVHRHLDERHLVEVFTSARKSLQQRAKKVGRPLDDFATTLQVAVLSDDSVLLGKIGDGYVLALERDGNCSKLVPLVENPLECEGGDVIDLTHPAWRSHLRVQCIADRKAAGIETVALASDGCSRFFVRTEKGDDANERRGVLHGEFIDGHLTGSLAKLGARNLFGYFANLMGHRQFVDEGDDRTLLIATLAPNSSLPCFPTTA